MTPATRLDLLRTAPARRHIAGTTERKGAGLEPAPVTVTRQGTLSGWRLHAHPDGTWRLHLPADDRDRYSVTVHDLRRRKLPMALDHIRPTED